MVHCFPHCVLITTSACALVVAMTGCGRNALHDVGQSRVTAPAGVPADHQSGNAQIGQNDANADRRQKAARKTVGTAAESPMKWRLNIVDALAETDLPVVPQDVQIQGDVKATRITIHAKGMEEYLRAAEGPIIFLSLMFDTDGNRETGCSDKRGAGQSLRGFDVDLDFSTMQVQKKDGSIASVLNCQVSKLNGERSIYVLANCRFRLEREPVFRPLGSRSVGCGASRLLGLGGRKSPGNWRSGDAAEVDGSRWKGELVSSGPKVELIASRAAGEAAVDVPLKIHGEPRRQDGWAVPQRALAAELGTPSTQRPEA
jgi:hypothetical protein